MEQRISKVASRKEAQRSAILVRYAWKAGHTERCHVRCDLSQSQQETLSVSQYLVLCAQENLLHWAFLSQWFWVSPTLRY